MLNRKETKRSFRTLRSTMTKKAFYDFCEYVAILCAERGPIYMKKYYTEKLLITDTCYNKILAYAIICNIVDDDTVDNIEHQLILDENLVPEEYINKVKLYFSHLRVLRQKYIIATFSNEKIIKIVNEYSESTNLSKQEVAEAYNVNIKIMDSLIIKSIIKNIISDDLLQKLKNRCMLCDPSSENKNRFNRLCEERNERRAALE